jgi:hypothetical protein
MQESTRRSFWTSFWGVLAGLFSASATANAAPTKINLDQIKVSAAGSGLVGFANGTGTPVAVGAGLALTGGTLSAPASQAVVRRRGVVLTRDASGNWPLPVGVRVNTSVWRNGMRQNPSSDYSIVADVVIPTPTAPWEADATVLVDGE